MLFCSRFLPQFDQLCQILFRINKKKVVNFILGRKKERVDARVVVITVHEDEAFAYLEIDE